VEKKKLKIKVDMLRSISKQSRESWSQSWRRRRLWWEGFAEMGGFKHGVKE